VAVKPKLLHFETTLHADGRASVENGEPHALGGEWTAEHLVLAGLAKCSLTSLAHFARQRGAAAEGDVRTDGTITRREDGSWGFVEIACVMDVTVEPEPDDLAGLLDSAEWGCFISSSLRPKPVYSWRVNGREIR
jgi:organic hydroperoxide reductase OsmC/OhrA